MAWIEFHSTRIVKLKKFQDFRVSLQMSKHEALGLLGSFWCEVLELREDGDITDWTPEYLVDLLGLKLSPERVWKALEAGWVDTVNERKLVHDWLDTSSIFLTRKYSSSEDGRERLRYIWSKHGRTYGSESQANGKRTVTGRTIPNLTIPNQPNLTKHKKVVGFDFECLWVKYPNKDGKQAAMRHFNASVKTDKDFEDIKMALENYLQSDRVKNGYIKNGSTWFNNWRDWIEYKKPADEAYERLRKEREDREKAIVEFRKGQREQRVDTAVQLARSTA